MESDSKLFNSKEFLNNIKNNVQGIYMIKCLDNGRVYIGQSIDVKSRVECHLNGLLNNKHPNAKLQNSYNKYKLKSFRFRLLEVVGNKNALTEREFYWATHFDAFDLYKGFNLKSIIKNLDENRLKKICEDINNGVDLEELSKKYGHGVATLYKIRNGSTHSEITKKYLNKYHEIRKGLDEIDVGIICCLLNDKVKTKTIAETFEVSTSCILDIRNGYSWEKISGEYLKVGYKAGQLRRKLGNKKAIEIRKSDKSVQELAELYGVLEVTIEQILKCNTYKDAI